jgi:hypothetical protein
MHIRYDYVRQKKYFFKKCLGMGTLVGACDDQEKY